MTERKIWIGTSWKMNHTRQEAQAFARTIKEYHSPHQLFIVPPFTALEPVSEILRDSSILVGAQNMHWEEHGAATGEISPLMIKDCGAQLVELGHSERRAEFGETDWTVNRKVLSALRHGLRPLVCVGETAIEKEFGVAREYVARQVKIALHGVGSEDTGQVLLAYEPVWAIGEKGTPAEPGYASSMHHTIREAVHELYGSKASEQMAILYGGSVNAANAASLVKQADVDGLFIGRAAWQVNSFIHLIQIVEQAVQGGS